MVGSSRVQNTTKWSEYLAQVALVSRMAQTAGEADGGCSAACAGQNRLNGEKGKGKKTEAKKKLPRIVDNQDNEA